MFGEDECRYCPLAETPKLTGTWGYYPNTVDPLGKPIVSPSLSPYSNQKQELMGFFITRLYEYKKKKKKELRKDD